MSRRLGWVGFVVVAASAIGARSEGQEVVPGGWSPTVGFQSLQPAALLGTPGYTAPAPWATVGAPMVPGSFVIPAPGAFSSTPWISPPQTRLGLVPFGETVRRTVRRRAGR